MQLTFLGGADEVGASSTLLEVGGKRILVDAGIRISPRTSRGIQNDQLPDLHPISAAGGIDYLLVTHAHTDHTGALPLIVEQYPHVPVLATRPTLMLTGVLQRDAQRIMKSRHEQEGELPIFDEVASDRLLNAMQIVEYGQPVRLGDGLQVTYHPSGHIAGAASLVIEGEMGVLVMSGDVSLNDQRAVVSAKLPNIKADALVLESTYGGRLHANRVAEERRLIDTLVEVTERGGKALIPAFALGRAQEVIQIILAYRDRLAAPVYVDGMVRAVCNGYNGFSDLLPERTVRAAGDSHLFFREKIKAVESGAMREHIARSDEPCVIVASSGMLTGGASVAYAKALVGDPRNAIFLTGYQDEESPGRQIQRIIKDRQEGVAASLKLEGRSYEVLSTLDTYSLSAHADETELVNMSEALNPQDVMLVHGDPSARHSLGTALRQRGRRVLLPKIGQTITLEYAKRPWALGGVKSGHETKPLDAKALWEAVQDQAGSFFSAKELAQMWWGDAERAREAQNVLERSLYFAQDWRSKNTFQVRSAGQVAREQLKRAIMMANPDIVGKVVVLRDSNNRPRAGTVVSATEDGFEADVYQAKGRNYPGDALLWVIGDIEFDREAGSKRSQIGDMLREAKALQDTLLPFAQRQKLAQEGKPVQPENLLPANLPENVTPQLALLSVVLALAGDGAILEQGGLLPKRAREDEPMEQNQAREMALVAFPPEARMRKAGMEVHRKRLTLTFDFPEVATRRYADEIEQLEEQTGWEVRVRPVVNMQALGDLIMELLPEGGRIVKGPSYFMDKREVQVELSGVDDPSEISDAYLDMTGYRLVTGGQKPEPAASTEANAVPVSNDGQRLEINQAYSVIKAALESKGLYKAGLKHGQIILTFISPQVGERYTDLIAELSQQTGYPLEIYPHPNQQQILQEARFLLSKSGWQVRKGPGIHTDKCEVSVKLDGIPEPSTVTDLSAQLEDVTGYRLIVE